jgi:pimeloyl-ACP methyl ester carboxylesterase
VERRCVRALAGRAFRAGAVAALALVAAPAATAAPSWQRCRDAEARDDGARCGIVSVPLDRSGRVAGRIGIYFELYGRLNRRRPRLSTMVSIEGGPGYSTTTDRASRLALAGLLRDRRDLVLVDLRGTGRSAPVDCHAFDSALVPYLARSADCARQLGEKVDLYGTHAAVEDLAAVLGALRTGPVDLYGDSYGSYFAQDFALWHPRLLRTLVLDATYAVPGTDPFWRDLAQATRDAIVRACARWPRCPVPPSQAIALLTGFVQQVRAHPFGGVAPDADGTRRLVRVDENALVLTAFGGAFTYVVWRDLLAAVVAAEHGDRAPILRLVAENAVPAGGQGAVRDYSEGLYLAVICQDYPQPFDVAAPYAVRAAQFAASQAALPDALYAPFSAEAFTGTEYQGAGACLRWPAPAHADPPGPPVLRYPDVPTLVLVGDLDTITPLADSAVVARRFPRGRLVVIRNQVHVTALADHDGCAARIVRRFVRVKSAGDTSCALRFAEVRVVRSFPRTVAEADPATRVRGDRSTLRDRRAAAVAAAVVGDALARWQINYSGVDQGLRGGTWSYEGDDVQTFTFNRARLARDLAVSGTARWTLASGAVVADLVLRDARGRRLGSVRVRFSENGPRRPARLAGTVRGHRLRAVMLAP